MAMPMRRSPSVGTYESQQVTGSYEGRSGSEITFLPSTGTFTKTEFDFDTLEHRLRELAFLNSGVRIVLTDRSAASSRAARS